jgi:twitching motility protein PilT
MQLAMSLTAVISQQLIPAKDGEWRVLTHEVLINNDAVRNTILQWATHQLYSVLELSEKDGMILMDRHLQALYQNGFIDMKTFEVFIRDKDLLRTYTNV